MIRFLAKLRALFRKEKLDRDMAEETRFHLAERAADYVDEGMPPDEAGYEAQRRFGNVGLIQETVRETRSFAWLEGLMQDLRFAARSLRKSPVFATTVLVSLALGIGANTGTFSIADAVLFRALPVREPDELVLVRWLSGPNPPLHYLTGEFVQNGKTKEVIGAALPHVVFRAMRDQQKSLSAVFASATIPRLGAVVDGRAENISGHLVSGDYFAGLGLIAESGRLISAGDDQPGAVPVAVLGHEYWQRHFQGSRTVVGRTFLLNGMTCTIIGVSPRSFAGTLQFGAPPDVFVPLCMQRDLMPREKLLDDPGAWWLQVMGRISSGADLASARTDLGRIFDVTLRNSGRVAGRHDTPILMVEAGRQGWTGRRLEQRQPLLVLISVALLILGMGCSTSIGLNLARGYRRQKEIGVRIAIGATRGRLFRQMLTEGVVLGVAAGGLGLWVARWSVDFLAAHLLPTGAPPIGIDGRMLTFAFGFSLLATLASSLLPAYHIAGTSTWEALKREAGDVTIGRSLFRWGGAIVTGQIALSFVLLIAATLLLRTLYNLEGSDVGIDERNLVGVKLDVTQAGTRERRSTALDEIMSRIAALPGVQAVGLSRHHLLSDNATKVRISPPPSNGQDTEVIVHANWVTGGFFEATNIPLIQGRYFDRRDGSAKIIVVNEAFVRSYLKEQNLVGEVISGNEIVGVVGNTKYESVRADAPPTIFFPYKADSVDSVVALTIRGDYPGFAANIPRIVREVSPLVTVFELRTFAAQREYAIHRDRVVSQLTSSFAGLAAVMTLLGVFGLLSYYVAARKKEIAVRVALGAGRGDIISMVLKRGLALVAIGVGLGLAGALSLMRVLASVLYEIEPTDPLTFVTVSFLLLVVATFASWLPAHRATRVDPMIALRSE